MAEEKKSPEVKEEVDVVENIKETMRIDKSHADEALKNIKAKQSAQRVAECEAIITETMYFKQRTLLMTRKSSKLMKLEKEFMKEICLLDKEGKPCGGLLKDVEDGKLSKTQFEDKKRELSSNYRKQRQAVEDENSKLLKELRIATPGYCGYWDWTSNGYNF